MQRIYLGLMLLVLVFMAACSSSGSSSSSTRIAPASQVTDASSRSNNKPMAAMASVQRRSLADSPFEFSWDLQLPAAVHMSWVSPEIPDLVFLQTEKRQIHAIEIKTGHTKWVSRALPKLLELEPQVVREELPGRQRGEIVLDDRLYVLSDSILFCIDAVYGQIIWRYLLPFEPSTGPYATGSGKGLRIFIGDWQGHLRTVTYHEEKMNPYVLWQWNLRGAAMADPIGSDGLVYVGNDRGVLECFDHDRNYNWAYNIGNTMRGTPVIRGQSLYFGSIDNVFHVINRLSGEVMGQLYMDAPLERKPFTFSYDGKRIYTWTGGKGKEQGLYAIDTIPDRVPYKDTVDEKFPREVERLQVAWFQSGMSNMVGASQQHLFTTYSGDSTVYALNRRTGVAEWAWDVSETTAGKPFKFCNYIDYNGSNQSIITFGLDGKMTAYRLFGQLAR